MAFSRMLSLVISLHPLQIEYFQVEAVLYQFFSSEHRPLVADAPKRGTARLKIYTCIMGVGTLYFENSISRRSALLA
jgi:hypothetical protein